jgi:hypothetical protein
MRPKTDPAPQKDAENTSKFSGSFAMTRSNRDNLTHPLEAALSRPESAENEQSSIC